MGLSATSSAMGVERLREIQHGGDSTLLFYFSPELAFSFASIPNVDFVFRLHHRPGAERAGLFDFFRPFPPPRLCKRQGDLQVLCAGRFVPNPATQSFAHVSRDVATDEIGLPHSARPRVFDPISAPETTCHQPIFHQVSTKVMGTKNPALQGFQAGLGF